MFSILTRAPRNHRMAVALLVMVATVSVVVGVGPAPALAVSHCDGSTCVHVDPGPTDCGGANGVALESVTAPGGGATVVLKWSEHCHSNWTRWSGGTSGPGYWDYWTESRGAASQGKTFNASEWTYMVNGYLAARACIRGIADPTPACTHWY